MNYANHSRIKAVVAILSFASLVVFAASAPSGSTAGETQSFIGTTPNATVVEEQPATF